MGPGPFKGQVYHLWLGSPQRLNPGQDRMSGLEWWDVAPLTQGSVSTRCPFQGRCPNVAALTAAFIHQP